MPVRPLRDRDPAATLDTAHLDRHPHLQRAGDPPRRRRRPARAAQAARLELRDHPGRERLARTGRIEIGHELAAKYDDPADGQVKIISMGEPNYGKALKQGILLARGDLVICDEIDLCDTDFHQRAMEILETGAGRPGHRQQARRRRGRRAAPLPPRRQHGVLHAPQGHARLPWDRHARPQGLPPRRRCSTSVRACLVEKDVFASEFVIRADRGRDRDREIPVRIIEKRPPSINLFKRVPERDEEPRQAHLGDPRARLKRRSGKLPLDADPVRGRRRGDGARHPEQGGAASTSWRSGHKVRSWSAAALTRCCRRRSTTSSRSSGLTIRYVDNALDRDGSLARNVLAAPGLLFGQRERLLPTRSSTSSPTPSSATSTRSRTCSPSATGCRSSRSTTSRSSAAASYHKFAKHGAKIDYELTKAFVKAKLPGCDHYAITSFFEPPIREANTRTTRRSCPRSCARRSSRRRSARAPATTCSSTRRRRATRVISTS